MRQFYDWDRMFSRLAFPINTLPITMVIYYAYSYTYFDSDVDPKLPTSFERIFEN